MEAKETVELLDAIFGLADATRAALSDGKVSISDAPYFFQPAFKLPTAIGGIEKVPRELADLSDAGRAEVMGYARERFDLPDDRLEVLIEETLRTGWEFAEHIRELVIYKRSKAA